MTAPVFELPQLYVGELPAGSEWWHCFTMSHPDFTCGPLVAYLKDYRFALVKDEPPGTIERATYYIGETARSALHETVLRGQNPAGANGLVHLRPNQLANRALARLTLNRPMPVIKLHSPARQRLGITKGSPLDPVLDRLERTDAYAATRQFAGYLDAQCRADANWSQPLPGLMWSSRQIPQDLVAVLYAPFHDDSAWTLQEAIPLDSSEGRALIDEALGAGDMRLAPDPRLAPPAGTDPDATP